MTEERQEIIGHKIFDFICDTYEYDSILIRTSDDVNYDFVIGVAKNNSIHFKKTRDSINILIKTDFTRSYFAPFVLNDSALCLKLRSVFDSLYKRRISRDSFDIIEPKLDSIMRSRKIDRII